MGKGKLKQLVGSKEDKDGDEFAGSTLEEYFATHKVSGLVSQHLLNIPSETNNVMAVEKIEEWDQSLESKSEQENYEDDYELDEAATMESESVSKVAGMSLCDYLHVKGDDSAEAKEKMTEAGSNQGVASLLALASEKSAAISDVTGMSLDHYLGTAKPLEENGSEAQADKKASPKAKRKGSKYKQTGAVRSQAKSTFSVIGCGGIHNGDSSRIHNVTLDEASGLAGGLSSSLTPFQRRQKRKDKARSKQQRNLGNKPSVSKAILVSEGLKEREKRKSLLNASHHPTHHGLHSSASNHQSPLPKLALSPSICTLSHKDHDVEDEKLPLL